MNLTPANMLVPGQEYRTRDSDAWLTPHRVNVLSHRVSIQNTDGTWKALFPDTKVETR